MSEDNTLLIYQDENEITRISVRFAEEDLWITQGQLAEIYDTTQQNISQHIEGIYQDTELDKNSTNKKFLLVEFLSLCRSVHISEINTSLLTQRTPMC